MKEENIQLNMQDKQYVRARSTTRIHDAPDFRFPWQGGVRRNLKILPIARWAILPNFVQLKLSVAISASLDQV